MRATVFPTVLQAARMPTASRYARNGYVEMNFIDGPPAGFGFAFTRPSSGYYIDANGFITTVGVDVARVAYDPVTLVKLGLLIEEGKTNLCLRSAEIDNAAWTKTDTTITADQVTSPAGSTGGDLCTEGAAGTAQVEQGVTVSSGTINAASIFLKRGNTDWVSVSFVDTATGLIGGRTWVNLATGALGTVATLGVAANVSAGVIPYGNGWYRVYVLMSIAATTGYKMVFHSASADNSTTRVSNATYYAWGGHIEATNAGVTVLTEYIPTAGSTVTRSGESVLTTTISDFFSGTEGSIYWEVIPKFAKAGRQFSLHNAAATESLQTQFTSTGTVQGVRINAGASRFAPITVNTCTGGVLSKGIMTYDGTDIRICLGGGAVVTDAFTLPGPLDRLRVGHSVGSGFLNGYVRKLRFYKRKLSNADMIAVTT